MIVKIKNNDNGFNLYESNHVKYWNIDMKTAIEVDKHDHVWNIGENDKEKDKLILFLLYLYNDRGELFEKIITSYTTYILNNNGKTIDRLL